jgi:signal transduction histidine kinase
MLGLDRLEELNEDFDRVATQLTPISGDTGLSPSDRLFDHAFKGNSTVRQLHVRNERTGETRDVRSAAAPIRLPDGAIIGAVTVNTDITEQKEAAERAAFLDEAMKVLSSSLDYRVILERLATLAVPRLADLCIIDLLTGDKVELERVAIGHVDAGKVALVDEWRRRFPLRRDSDSNAIRVLNTGKPNLICDFTPERLRAYARNEDHFRLLNELRLKALLTVPLVTREERIGTLTLCTAESGRRYDEGDLAFAEELALRASLAVDNARLYREAQEAIRARDELLSIAAHDLRSPLASLSLQLQTVLRKAQAASEEVVPSDWIRPKLEMMGHQLSRVSVMLEDLLDVSRIHAGRMRLELEEIDLAALVRDVLSRFEEAIQTAGCKLTTHISPQLLGCWDRLRLEQVVTNLVSNAIKYGRQSPIEVTLTRLDHAARLTVRDQGVGIAPEHHESIFRRFERAGDQTAYQGTGLGLWIVRRIVEAMHGTIHVESALGQGSQFIVELPLRS